MKSSISLVIICNVHLLFILYVSFDITTKLTLITYNLIQFTVAQGTSLEIKFMAIISKGSSTVEVSKSKYGIIIKIQVSTNESALKLFL